MKIGIGKFISFKKISNNVFAFAKKLRSYLPKKKYLTRTLFLLIIAYISLGSFVAWKVYKVKNINKNDLKLLTIYPMPAVIVNGNIIFAKNVYQQVNFVEQFSKQTNQKIDSKEDSIKKIIDQKVEDSLIIAQAVKKNVTVNDSEIDKVLNDIAKENESAQELEKVLNALYGMSLSDFRVLIRSQLFKDKVTDQVIKNIKVRHILISKESDAQRLIDELRKGDRKFESAASEFSKDANTKDKQGDLGKVARGTMPPDFEKVAFDEAKIGEVSSKPVKTDFGYHIILVDEKTGYINKSYTDWVKELKENAQIIRFMK